MAPKTNGWYWITLLAMMAGLALYASERNLPGLHDGYTKSSQQLQTLEETAQRLEREKLRLEHKIMGLDTDSVIQESAIRKNTKHIRKDETVFKVDLPNEQD